MTLTKDEEDIFICCTGSVNVVLGGGTSPIALDVDGSGVVERIAFDFAANGEKDKATEWFSPTGGILVDTRIPGPMTGAELQGLAIWTDANSNAKLDEGELSSLTAHRIVSLSTRHIGYIFEATLADGTTMLSEDLWFPVILPPMAQPVAKPVSINAVTLSLSGSILLALILVTDRRRRKDPVPGTA